MRAPAGRAGILAGLLGIALLVAGCGQPGTLYLPNSPAAAHRATLPESLWPGPVRRAEPASAPASAPSSTGTAEVPAGATQSPARSPAPATSTPTTAP